MFLLVRCLSVLFFFSIWKVLGNKIILKKSSKKLIRLRRQTKKLSIFSRGPESKVTLDTSSTVDVYIGLHFYLRKSEYIFSGNEHVSTKTTSFFPRTRWVNSFREREQQIFFPGKITKMEKSYLHRTLMTRYANAFSKNDEILWQLPVDLVQVFHEVLR
jgi:hypothetical protein